MTKERLDILVQERFQVSRSAAQGLIRTGRVRASDGSSLTRPGMRLDPEMPITLESGPRFVSRGGEKLEHALHCFGVQLRQRVAIDVGASTGGFTDCLLRYGASRVYAIDVGYGQLAWNLRQDERVIVMERCNIRELAPDKIPEKPAFFTVDCSFISLTLVLPPLLALLGDDPEGIVLIKPQFEAGREQVGKGGVVRDPRVHREVIYRTADYVMQLGFTRMSVTPSPLLGPAGNREFLAHLSRLER